MIQDIAPHSFLNEFTPRAPEPGDFVLYFSGKRVLCAISEHCVTLPTWSQAAPQHYHFGFLLDGRAVFLADDAPVELPGFTLENSYGLRLAAPQHIAFAIGIGGSLQRWYGATRFCGSCGAKMADSTLERARVCPDCGSVCYPRICPAVIVAITDGERLLLTRYQGRAFKAYALVAGFNEIGESIEATVHREVFEETGLRVHSLRYYRSQPWVFTDSLLMGFFAELDGSDKITLQQSELSEAAWVPRGELPEEHSAISLTGEMIELFRAGKEPKSPL